MRGQTSSDTEAGRLTQPKISRVPIIARYASSFALICVLVFISVALQGFPKWEFRGPFQFDPGEYPFLTCFVISALVFLVTVGLYDELSLRNFLGVSAINGFTYNATIFSFLGVHPKTSEPGQAAYLVYTQFEVSEGSGAPIAILLTAAGVIFLGWSLLLVRRRIRAFSGVASEIEDLSAKAITYFELGEQKGDDEALRKAIFLLRQALRGQARESVPLDWAMTQNNLGTALTRLGERESGTARLEEAVAAYRAALEEYTRERVPLQWAATQNNLGTALWTLGQRASDTGQLEEALSAFRAALEENTREHKPLDWAMTQNNLGNALAALGEGERDTARLEEAVASYRAALEEYTRERVPLQWAMTQNNLGNALLALGEGECGTARSKEAVAAYRAALKEYTRERVPLQWVTTQNNLGKALWKLGKRQGDPELLREALNAVRNAQEVFVEEAGHAHRAAEFTQRLQQIQADLNAMERT